MAEQTLTRSAGVLLTEPSDAPMSDEARAGTTPKYPPPLLAEYKRLVQGKLAGGLTENETQRLSDLMSQINAIDLADPDTQRSLEDVRQTRLALTSLREDLEKELATLHK